MKPGIILSSSTLLLAVAAASAGPSDLLGDFTAASLHGRGSTSFEAPLVAFLQEQAWSGPVLRERLEGGGANPGFTLRAQQLRVETDASDPVLASGLYYHDRSKHAEVFQDAVVQGTVNEDGYRWNLFAMPGGLARVEVAAGCLDGKPSRQKEVVRAAEVDFFEGGRPKTVRATADAVKWECIEGSTVTVTGDLQLSLWFWNATLVAEGATRDLRTGVHQTRQAPAGLPDASAAVGEAREVYLFASNATLSVPLLAGQGYSLYTGPARVASTDLSLEGTTGRIVVRGEAQDLRGSALQATGRLQAGLAGTGVAHPLRIQLAGEPDSVSVDGLALAVVAAGTGSSPPWLFGLLGLVTAGSAAAALPFAIRRRRLARRAAGEEGDGLPAGQRSLDEAYDCLKEDRFGEALRHAARAARQEGDGSEVAFVRALCLGGLGRLREALREHDQAESRLQLRMRLGEDFAALRAENAYEAARTCLRLGAEAPDEAAPLRDQALRWLRTAVRLQGLYLKEGRNDPLLCSLVQELAASPGDEDWWENP